MKINEQEMSREDHAQAYNLAAFCYPSALEADRRHAERRGDTRVVAVHTEALRLQGRWLEAERRLDRAA